MIAELGGQTKQLFMEAFSLIDNINNVSYERVMEMTLLEKQWLSEYIEKKLNNEAKMLAKNPLFKLLR